QVLHGLQATRLPQQNRNAALVYCCLRARTAPCSIGPNWRRLPLGPSWIYEMSSKIAWDKPLDDYHIKPAAIEACIFLVHPDLTKTMFSAERAAGRVERKNARQQFP